MTATSSSDPRQPPPFRTARDRRMSNPTRASRAALGIAVAFVPAAQRHRYTMEFLAELHDVGRPAQLRHALGLVAHAWALRLALQDSSPRIEEGPAMRKSIRCTLHVHHDVRRYNGEVQPPDKYFQCTRCGRVRNLPSSTGGYIGWGW